MKDNLIKHYVVLIVATVFLNGCLGPKASVNVAKNLQRKFDMIGKNFYFVKFSQENIYGTGMVATEKQGVPIIGLLMKNSPAGVTNLRQGDQLASINGIKASRDNINELNMLLTCRKNKSVRIAAKGMDGLTRESLVRCGNFTATEIMTQGQISNELLLDKLVSTELERRGLVKTDSKIDADYIVMVFSNMDLTKMYIPPYMYSVPTQTPQTTYTNVYSSNGGYYYGTTQSNITQYQTYAGGGYNMLATIPSLKLDISKNNTTELIFSATTSTVGLSGDFGRYAPKLVKSTFVQFDKDFNDVR